MRRLIFYLIFIAVCIASAQGQSLGSVYHHTRYATVLDGDTIPLYHLREVSVTGWTRPLLTEREIQHNKKLIRNVKKMLPYAKIGKQRLDLLESQIAQMPKRDRKAAIKKAESDITAEFSDELKKCTFSQGKVLIKLIDRETGRTAYKLVDDLRGRFRTTFYQVFARIFGLNLKTHYDPNGNKEDNLMERIVLSIERGLI
ncbi:MAG: DUF4294 domain-containing protein [Bacteroidales bacterium]|nr:DUF4294 domain-containing protein [Candidatus Colimorpha onthohippi]